MRRQLEILAMALGMMQPPPCHVLCDIKNMTQSFADMNEPVSISTVPVALDVSDVGCVGLELTILVYDLIVAGAPLLIRFISGLSANRYRFIHYDEVEILLDLIESLAHHVGPIRGN